MNGATAWTKLLGVVATCLLAGAAFAAQDGSTASSKPAPTRADARSKAHVALFKGRYLEALSVLEAAVAAGDRSVASALEQLMPFVTGIPAPQETASLAALDPEFAGKLKQAVPHDAIAAIVERARATRIVILNEAHDEPRHRAFGLEVARALRPLGYSMLAMEAFTNFADREQSAQIMASLAKDGHPRRSTGYYINDPVFGDFVRQALALGYRPVAYEETSRDQAKTAYEGVVAREQEQADNLARHLSSAGPSAKMLAYVGYSHAAESPIPYGEGGQAEWMGARLKRMTGIDPLTIDQTELREASPSAEVRAWHAILAAKLRRRSAVFVRAGKPLKAGHKGEAVDLQVVHPVTTIAGGRPTYLRTMGRRPVAIPATLIPTTGRRLVQAFVAGEADDAVPVDQVLVTAGKRPPKLMLPKAAIRYVFQER